MINRAQVGWILRLDAIFNGLAGLILYFFFKPIIQLVLFPDTNKPIYANVLGAALIGLSLDVWFAANDPGRLREAIWAGIITRLLVAPAILYWLLIAGIDLPPIWLGLVAVGAQVLLILGEAAYLLSTQQK
jgi:hypothetical protein